MYICGLPSDAAFLNVLQSPSEDSLYQQLVEELHSHDVSNGLASVTKMAMFIAPGTADNLDKTTN